MVLLHFPRGVPGFETYQCFTLTEADSPLALLASIDPGGPSFHAVPVSVVDPEYQIGITPEDLRELGLDETKQPVEGVLFLAILSLNDGALTANLLAPVVVNLSNGAAVQAVRNDTRYSHQHPAGGPLREAVECS